MRSTTVATGFALALAIVSLAGAVHAGPSSRADALIAQANMFAASGDFANAAVKFQDAFAVEPRPELICNVGVAYNKANDLPRAQRFLTDCTRVGTALDGDFMTAVRERLASIEMQLRAGHFKPVTITVSPAAGASVTIADWGTRERLVGSRIVWLAFGVHELDATADGYRAEHRTLTVTTRDPTTVSFELARVLEPVASRGTSATTPSPPSAGASPPPAPRVATSDADTTVAPPIAPPAESSSAPSRTPAYVFAAVTGVALVAAIASYVETSHAVDHIDVNGSQTQYQDGVDSAHHWRDTFYAATAVTVVAAGVTAYLWTRARPSSHTELNIVPSSSGAAALLSGSF